MKVSDVLEAMVARGELTASGASTLGDLTQFRDAQGPDAIGRLFAYLDDSPTGPIETIGQRCRNRTYQPDEGKSDVEQLVEVLPGIKPGSAAELARELAPELSGLPRSRQAREVVRFLERRENRHFLTSPPPLPWGEENLLSILNSEFRDVIPHGRRAELARSMAKDHRNCHHDRALIVEGIAKSLVNPVVAESLGCRPIAKDDRRLKAAARARLAAASEAARGDGRSDREAAMSRTLTAGF